MASYHRLPAIIAVLGSQCLFAQCQLSELVSTALLRRIDTISGHPEAGPLKIEFINRGDIVLYWLASVQQREPFGESYAMTFLGRLYPDQPRLSSAEGWNPAAAREPLDFIRQVNLEFERHRRLRLTDVTDTTPDGGAHLSIAAPPEHLSRRERARREALDVKYPACSMRPNALQRAPELKAPVTQSEVCTMERDWRDVVAARPAKRPLSPEDAVLKAAMNRAIIRAVARAAFEDPGRNHLLVDDFSVDDESTGAVLATKGGEIRERFAVRLDKNDPCLAAAAPITGGCSPCSNRIDPERRKRMLEIYPAQAHTPAPRL